MLQFSTIWTICRYIQVCSNNDCCVKEYFKCAGNIDFLLKAIHKWRHLEGGRGGGMSFLGLMSFLNSPYTYKCHKMIVHTKTSQDKWFISITKYLLSASLSNTIYFHYRLRFTNKLISISISKVYFLFSISYFIYKLSSWDTLHAIGYISHLKELEKLPPYGRLQLQRWGPSGKFTFWWRRKKLGKQKFWA